MSLVVSVHIVETGALRAPSLRRKVRKLDGVEGMTYAEAGLMAPLNKALLPAPQLGRVGVIAAWKSDEGIDQFLAENLVGQQLAGGWHVRMEPLRVSGSWEPMPGLPLKPLPVDDGEPVAILTLGQLRLGRGLAFLRSAARAEAEVVESPALLASTGLARPPHLFSTFSIWRSAAEMKAYSYTAGGGHRAAIDADREKAFHHESAFIRFRPYASAGSWDGVDPLWGLIGAPSTQPLS